MARPRTPTALKLIKGTAQPCRTNKREPKPARAIPSPPDHLSDRAKLAWGRVTVLLDRMGVLTEADGLAVEGLTEAYADLVEARQALAARRAEYGGELTYDGTGPASGKTLKAFPEWQLVSDADKRFKSWLIEFGLSPAARSKVSAIAEKEDDDPWAKL